MWGRTAKQDRVLIWRAAGGMDSFLTKTHVPQLWHRVSVLSVSLIPCLSVSLFLRLSPDVLAPLPHPVPGHLG